MKISFSLIPIKENSEIENAKDICSETNSLNQCEKLILGVRGLQ